MNGGVAMFVILTYDIDAKRVAKVMKICRRYLNHVQKSVFEGMLTDGQLNRLKGEIRKQIVVDEDSCCIYTLSSLKYTQKELIGVHDNFDIIL